MMPSCRVLVGRSALGGAVVMTTEVVATLLNLRTGQSGRVKVVSRGRMAQKPRSMTPSGRRSALGM